MFAEWSPGFAVGVEKIDREHQRLFSIINDLYDCYNGKLDRTELKRIVTSLIDYSVVHFHVEESLMRRYEFPGLDEHLREHEEFKKGVRELSADIHFGKDVDMLPTLQFLTEWLASHIGKADHEYVEYAVDHGVYAGA